MLATSVFVIVSNYVLTFLVISLVASGVAIARAPQPVSRAVVVDNVNAT